MPVHAVMPLNYARSTGHVSCLASAWLVFRASPDTMTERPSPPLPASGNTEQPAETASPLIAVRDVTKSFGSTVALEHVSFDVPAGQICGLLGPNGAGKTTLFRLLMGILKATSGGLAVDGLDAFDDRVEVKRVIGYLPDEPVFYSYMSGREILELSAAMHGLNVSSTMEQLSPRIEGLHLDTGLDHFAEDYSRGMKKKLGLLLAMLHEPRVLVLDEPTNGLDVEATHLFYDIILDAAKRGTTVLFSTHLMDHVSALCSHVVIINEGTVATKGEIGDLRARFDGASLEQIFLRLTSRPRA